MVVCDVESGEEEMVRIGERISDALARPYRIDGRTLVRPGLGRRRLRRRSRHRSLEAAQPGRRRHVRRQVEPAPAAPLDDGLTGGGHRAARRRPELRVALVCPYSLSRPGGVQGQVLGLARGLGGRGHEVTVFAPLDGAGGRARRRRPRPDRPLGLAAGQRLGRPVAVSVRSAARALRARPGPSTWSTSTNRSPRGCPTDCWWPAGIPADGGDLPPQRGQRPLHGAAAAGPTVRRRPGRRGLRSPRRRPPPPSAPSGGRFEVLFNGVEIDRYEASTRGRTDRADRPVPRPARGAQGPPRPPRGLRPPASTDAGRPQAATARCRAAPLDRRRRTGDRRPSGGATPGRPTSVARGAPRGGEGPAAGRGRRAGRAVPRGRVVRHGAARGHGGPDGGGGERHRRLPGRRRRVCRAGPPGIPAPWPTASPGSSTAAWPSARRATGRGAESPVGRRLARPRLRAAPSSGRWLPGRAVRGDLPHRHGRGPVVTGRTLLGR